MRSPLCLRCNCTHERRLDGDDGEAHAASFHPCACYCLCVGIGGKRGVSEGRESRRRHCATASKIIDNGEGGEGWAYAAGTASDRKT